MASSQRHIMSVSFYRFRLMTLRYFDFSSSFLMVLCSKLRYILAGIFLYKRSITFLLFLVGFWWEIPLVNIA